MSRYQTSHVHHSCDSMDETVYHGRITSKKSFHIPSWHQVRRFAKEITQRKPTNTDKSSKVRRERANTSSPSALVDGEPVQGSNEKEYEGKRRLFEFRRHSFDSMNARNLDTIHIPSSESKTSAHQRTQAAFHENSSFRHRVKSRKESRSFRHFKLGRTKSKRSDSSKQLQGKGEKYPPSSYNSDEDSDVDLLHERLSFTKRTLTKSAVRFPSPTETESSSSWLCEADSLVSDTCRHVSFADTNFYFPNEKSTSTLEIENYEDILVRVARFAVHDQRRKARKVRDLLERTLSYLYHIETKHGFVTRLSNEEIRMWRRVIVHDWDMEENVVMDRKVVQYKESEDERWEIPENLETLEKIVEVANNCLSFGDVPFSLLNIAKLCQLEMNIESEEDGWI